LHNILQHTTKFNLYFSDHLEGNRSYFAFTTKLLCQTATRKRLDCFNKLILQFSTINMLMCFPECTVQYTTILSSEVGRHLDRNTTILL
jgi:hypothetical protein